MPVYNMITALHNIWHYFNQLHDVVTWNAFQLIGLPCQKLLKFNAFETISCVVLIHSK